MAAHRGAGAGFEHVRPAGTESGDGSARAFCSDGACGFNHAISHGRASQRNLRRGSGRRPCPPDPGLLRAGSPRAGIRPTLMQRAGLSTVTYLALVFVSGVAVGGFGMRLYTLSSVTANVSPRNPDEFRRRYVAELRDKL